MDDKRPDEILNEKVTVDKDVHFNSTAFGIDPYTEIFGNAKTTRPIPNPLKVNEALFIMLKVTHLFKYSIDMYYDHVDDSESDYMQKEIEDIINHRNPAVKKRAFKITPGHLSDLLLQVLYAINGSYYRVNDPDYALEEELDEILKLPNWSYELDSAITKSILLPLYYSKHSDQDDDE
jgi:hypothetical protein